MKKKRVFVIGLTFVLLISIVLSSCGRDDNTVIDTTKTTLYLGVGISGVGSKWLKETAVAFEELYKDYSFEEGKVGVQAVVEPQPFAAISGTPLITNMRSLRSSVLFTEDVTYHNLVNAGVLGDITDVVTEPLDEFGEVGVTIEDKLDPHLRDFLNKDGKYYALPYYEGLYGFYYDVDLFENLGFYIAESFSTPSDMFITPAENRTRSKGPDGVSGTLDDGLPTTYDEFFALLDHIYANNTVPFVWTGRHILYLMRHANALWAANEGYDGMLLNLTLDGNAKIVKTVSDGEISETEIKTISEANGYELQKQVSKFKALQFIKRLVDNPDYYLGASYGNALSHLDAQAKFLRSRRNTGERAIAMIAEGSWWYNEADATFKAMEIEFGSEYSRDNRRIGLLPMPKPDASYYDSDSPNYDPSCTMISENSAFAFLNPFVTGVAMDVAKLFMKFAHTDKALTIFTRETGMTKGLSYEIPENEFSTMSYYAQSVYNIHKNANIIYPYSKVSKILNNASIFYFPNWGFSSTTSGKAGKQTNPFEVFHEYPELTVEDYFKGMSDYTVSFWSTLR